MGAPAVLLWPRPSPVPPSDEGPWKLQDPGRRRKKWIKEVPQKDKRG